MLQWGVKNSPMHEHPARRHRCNGGASSFQQRYQVKQVTCTPARAKTALAGHCSIPAQRSRQRSSHILREGALYRLQQFVDIEGLEDQPDTPGL